MSKCRLILQQVLEYEWQASLKPCIMLDVRAKLPIDVTDIQQPLTGFACYEYTQCREVAYTQAPATLEF